MIHGDEVSGVYSILKFFNEEIKKYENDCYDIFYRYLQNKKKGNLYLVNDKKLKIKNIQVFDVLGKQILNKNILVVSGLR